MSDIVISKELLDILIASEEENVRLYTPGRDGIPGGGVSHLYHAALLAVLKDYKALKSLDVFGPQSYKIGVEDAWHAARVLNLPVEDGGMSYEDIYSLFETADTNEILKNYPTTEVIDAIRKYEVDRTLLKEKEYENTISNSGESKDFT